MNGTTTLNRSYAAAIDRPALNPTPAAVALVAIAAIAAYLDAAVSGRQSLLFLVGTFAGIVLYHAAFGFTSSWRDFLIHGRGAGIRAQMLMLASTCVVFFPLLAAGHAGGQTLRGSVSPIGVSVVVGAFLFGVGMQLGGGCASGTLYTSGGGNTRMLATLSAFVAGSVIATAHAPFWSALPAAKPASLITLAGMWGGLAISLALFAAIAGVSILIERRVHAAIAIRTVDGDDPLSSGARAAAPPAGSRAGASRIIGGPWPLAAGAIGLAIVNIATLLIAGRPWGITGAFAIWGAKIASALGVHVA